MGVADNFEIDFMIAEMGSKICELRKHRRRIDVLRRFVVGEEFTKELRDMEYKINQDIIKAKKDMIIIKANQ